jgi:hypothetical protein
MYVIYVVVPVEGGDDGRLFLHPKGDGNFTLLESINGAAGWKKKEAISNALKFNRSSSQCFRVLRMDPTLEGKRH